MCKWCIDDCHCYFNIWVLMYCIRNVFLLYNFTTKTHYFYHIHKTYTTWVHQFHHIANYAFYSKKTNNFSYCIFRWTCLTENFFFLFSNRKATEQSISTGHKIPTNWNYWKAILFMFWKNATTAGLLAHRSERAILVPFPETMWKGTRKWIDFIFFVKFIVLSAEISFLIYFIFRFFLFFYFKVFTNFSHVCF